MPKPFLTGNALKLIAACSMFLDHLGLLFFPEVEIFRILGRLAYPIFAFMIAEGCRYTRSRKRYLLSLVLVAALCQGVYFFAMGSMYQCILVTFSLSVGTVYLWDWAKGKSWGWAVMLAAVGALWFLCEGPVLPGTDFAIDYGIFGVLLPVLIYIGRARPLAMTALGLVLLGLSRGGIQWYGLLGLLPLALYSGQRGKYKLKYLFYIYYPAHLAIIWLIGYLL